MFLLFNALCSWQTRVVRWLTRVLLPIVCSATSTLAGGWITNGGFEQGLAGWRPLWCRQAGAGKVVLDSQQAHSGAASARIEHQGKDDWSFEPELRLPVQPGDVFELESWVRLQGEGSATLCVSTWNARGENVEWSYGAKSVQSNPGWRRLSSRFVVPPTVSQIQPRLIGNGTATVWVDDFSLTQKPGAANLRRKDLPRELALTNAALVVTLDTTDSTVSVLDRRTGRLWKQSTARPDAMILDARADGSRIDCSLLHLPSSLTIRARLELDASRPEFVLGLDATGELPEALAFPYAFASQSGDRLIVPMNEGISYPVEDAAVEPMRLVAYGGHGICMAFWGVTDDRAGHMAILETPDDAAIRIRREAGRLVIAPEWNGQLGQFGYERRLRYVFFDQGGHVAMAKRYRAYARQIGRFKTLTEKRRENPNVDLLIGAVNIWNWDSDPVALARELQAAGIERILWSRGGSADALRTLNELQVLTSRYDIYQDVMDPANFRLLRYVHGDWPTAAWPKDIILNAHGDWLRGWEVKDTNGQWHACGVICDRRALDYARERIPPELATRPYRCRFIDTTTAAPWHECYSTNHPMTRTQSREWKMKLLEYVSRDQKLVTGCETGHDAAVPFLHYFEGMLSLGPYRVPDAGRDIQRIWDNPPERVVKFQLGHTYRLPLWELVYHDCVVAQWYWGDYNNKLPALWQKRDLFNVLYGTPPMFMFDRKLWQAQKDRFVRSYRNICPHVRAAGYAEMTDHRFLTPDRNVQQTTFANGLVVTVNFGDHPFPMPSGRELMPQDYSVSGP